MYYGGALGGFIATRDEEKYVMEYPSRLFGICKTEVDGEWGFGDVAVASASLKGIFWRIQVIRSLCSCTYGLVSWSGNSFNTLPCRSVIVAIPLPAVKVLPLVP